jgi:hypothetical protein
MSLATITFNDETIHTKNGEKNGKPWEIREQAATVETPQMRMPVRINLPKGSAAFKVGKSTLDLVANLRVSDCGSLQLARNLQLQAAK